MSGSELLRAVRRGRLWLNLTHVDKADARYRTLIDGLYAELATQLPGFRALASQGTLLISSPRAMVYFHLDGPASVPTARPSRTSSPVRATSTCRSRRPSTYRSAHWVQIGLLSHRR